MKQIYKQGRYTSYGGAANPQEESLGQTVLQLQTILELLDLWYLQSGMQILQCLLEVNLMRVMEEMPQQGSVATKPGINKGAIMPLHQFRQDTQCNVWPGGGTGVRDGAIAGRIQSRGKYG